VRKLTTKLNRMDEKKIRELAMEYGLKCDPLNQTPEKQADIRQGFIEGMNQALNLFSVVPSFSDFYKELEGRMVVLEAKKDSKITEGRILELQLATIRVQQILLDNLN